MTMPVREDVTLDELGALDQKPSAIKLEDVKLEGDDVPEELKGKSAKDLLAATRVAAEALGKSEQARRDLEARLAAVPAPAAPAPVQPPPAPKELTKEEIAELYQRDPIEAIEYMNARAERRVEENFTRRLGTLATGATTSAETYARSKYPDEFSLFNDQIKMMVERLPDKTALVRPEAWDDMISYIRGLPANFDKLVEHRGRKSTDAAAETARAAQAAAAGPTVTPSAAGPKGPSHTGGGKLSDLEREVAGVLGVSEADYLKYKTPGSGE